MLCEIGVPGRRLSAKPVRIEIVCSSWTQFDPRLHFSAMDFFRKMVSGDKRRYVTDRYNLDLTYITDRVIGTPHPPLIFLAYSDTCVIQLTIVIVFSNGVPRYGYGSGLQKRRQSSGDSVQG